MQITLDVTNCNCIPCMYYRNNPVELSLEELAKTKPMTTSQIIKQIANERLANNARLGK